MIWLGYIVLLALGYGMIRDYPGGCGLLCEAWLCEGEYGQNSNWSVLKSIPRLWGAALECGETAVVAED